jgi:hypothetical protein
MIMRRMIGISHDPGYSAILCACGARKFIIYHQLEKEGLGNMVMEGKGYDCHDEEYAS